MRYVKILNDVVTGIKISTPEQMETFIDSSPGTWIEYDNNKWVDIGANYHQTENFFYPDKRYASWTLNTETEKWEAPIAYPDDDTGGIGENYDWDEDTQSWVRTVSVSE
jgi:hypothetical protein